MQASQLCGMQFEFVIRIAFRTPLPMAGCCPATGSLGWLRMMVSACYAVFTMFLKPPGTVPAWLCMRMQCGQIGPACVCQDSPWSIKSLLKSRAT